MHVCVYVYIAVCVNTYVTKKAGLDVKQSQPLAQDLPQPIPSRDTQYVTERWQLLSHGNHVDGYLCMAYNYPYSECATWMGGLSQSHDSQTTTNPHNPLYVLHRWY